MYGFIAYSSVVEDSKINLPILHGKIKENLFCRGAPGIGHSRGYFVRFTPKYLARSTPTRVGAALRFASGGGFARHSVRFPSRHNKT
jgi:hypothetical protein